MHGMYSVFIWYLSVDVSVRFLFLFFFFPPVLTSYKTCSKTFFFKKTADKCKKSAKVMSPPLDVSQPLFLLVLSNIDNFLFCCIFKKTFILSIWRSLDDDDTIYVRYKAQFMLLQ